ncbi:putative ribonuclease H-like domain-containing protein, partial [Tanacetum coccineum]
NTHICSAALSRKWGCYIYHHPNIGIFSSSSYDDDFGGTVTNLAPSIVVDYVPTKRVNTIHPQSQILGDLTSPVQTRGTLKKSKFGASAFVSYVHDQQRNNHIDYLHCLFACFLSQLEPSSVGQALTDPAWVEAIQEEMQQFINQKVLQLVPLPEGKFAIRTKRILKNKRDARGIVVRNKARLVAQGHRQEEVIDYDEVFAPVARIEAIRLFLAFASYMGFMVYQMDVKSAFLYREIKEEVYVTQPRGFKDPHFPKHVYRVVKVCMVFIKHQGPDDIIFGSTNKAWCDDFEVLMKGEFEMSAMGELTFFLGIQVKQNPDRIFISQDKYVQDMLKKFDMESVRSETTPFEALKLKSKDEPDDVVNVHLYRSMIGSLMYLTASRPDIQFAVSACSRHQVTPLTSNLNAVKKIFKYLKGQPKLGLWYPRDSPFVLEAYSDSDYAGSHGDRKSTTGGCQFLGRRLISWQCKKQTIVATSSTEAEYVAAASCCGQGSHIRYAITHDPIIYDSLSKDILVQPLQTSKEGPPAILATIDRTPYTITESIVRSQFKLEYEGGVEDFAHTDIYLVAWINLEPMPLLFLFDCGEGGNPHAHLLAAKLPPGSSAIAGVPLPAPTLHLSRPNDLLLTHISSTNVEDETMGGSLFKPRPPSVHSCAKSDTQESELKRHTSSVQEERKRHDVDPPYQAAKQLQQLLLSFRCYTRPVCNLPTRVNLSFVKRPSIRERPFRQREDDKVDWTDIRVKLSHQGLTADLLGPDVNEDNFAERMKAFMRTFVKNQSSTIYTTGWTMKHVKSFSDDQLKTEFDKIRTAAAALQSQNIRRLVPGRKRFGRKGVHPSHSTIPIEDGDLEAVHKMCLKYASDADYASDDDTPVNLHAVVDWELLPTGLGWINVIYRKDNSRKCFTSLREILHLVTRADLMTIYGRVMTFYQDKKAVGIGLVLWGDLKVLMDSPEVNDGCDVWKNQQTWKIQSWKLYSLFWGSKVLGDIGGLVVHMFGSKEVSSPRVKP